MIRFLLNGKARVLDIEPGRTALEHLRLHERLTGTKEGCAEGDCGACTIALGRPDDQTGLSFRAVNACILSASELDGALVLTAEGLAQDGAPAPVQQALVENHASQCGFCTPGIVMSLYAYAQSPAPEAARRRDVIYDALAGNLCRCTGYRPIMDAAFSLGHEADPRIPQWRAALDALPPADDPRAPRSMEELDALLAAAPDSRLLAGGTDLGVGIAKYGKIPDGMVSLRNVAGLDVIEERADALLIGAGAAYTEILPHLDRHFPAFAALVRRIGSVQIRNSGTMGGNVCNASPIGDSAPCLLALDAVFRVRSAAGTRGIPADAFFTGYRKTALQPGEYLQAIEIPFLKPNDMLFAYKVAKRFDQDISTVAAAFRLRREGEKIADLRAGFGGMAATPKRALAVEEALRGAASPQAFDAAKAAIAEDFTPLSDFRAPAQYRLQAAAGLLDRLQASLVAPQTLTDIWAL